MESSSRSMSPPRLPCARRATARGCTPGRARRKRRRGLSGRTRSRARRGKANLENLWLYEFLTQRREGAEIFCLESISKWFQYRLGQARSAVTQRFVGLRFAQPNLLGL